MGTKLKVEFPAAAAVLLRAVVTWQLMPGPDPEPPAPPPVAPVIPDPAPEAPPPAEPVAAAEPAPEETP